MSSIDEKGLELVISLLTQYADRKDALIENNTEQKLTSMQSIVNSVSKDMNDLSTSINDEMGQIRKEINDVNDGTVTDMSNQMTEFTKSMNEKIASMEQDFDNLDTEVNGISGKLDQDMRFLTDDEIDKICSDIENNKEAI